MANNYCISSSKLMCPEHENKKVQAIVDRVVKEIEEGKHDDWDFCGVDASVEDDGVWFSADESVNLEHMELIARALIEELEIDEPFYASWAYTCSKPRIDEFGGGAMVIKRGYETYWVDAMSNARTTVERGLLEKLKDK